MAGETRVREKRLSYVANAKARIAALDRDALRLGVVADYDELVMLANQIGDQPSEMEVHVLASVAGAFHFGLLLDELDRGESAITAPPITAQD